jgi:hypothetical protein
MLLQRENVLLSLAKTWGSLDGDPFLATDGTRGAGLRLSALPRVDGAQSPVDGGRKGRTVGVVAIPYMRISVTALWYCAALLIPWILVAAVPWISLGLLRAFGS